MYEGNEKRSISSDWLQGNNSPFPSHLYHFLSTSLTFTLVLSLASLVARCRRREMEQRLCSIAALRRQDDHPGLSPVRPWAYIAHLLAIVPVENCRLFIRNMHARPSIREVGIFLCLASERDPGVKSLPALTHSSSCVPKY